MTDNTIDDTPIMERIHNDIARGDMSLIQNNPLLKMVYEIGYNDGSAHVANSMIETFY